MSLEDRLMRIQDLSDALVMMAFGIQYHGGDDKAVGPGLHVVADIIHEESDKAIMDVLQNSRNMQSIPE